MNEEHSWIVIYFDPNIDQIVFDAIDGQFTAEQITVEYKMKTKMPDGSDIVMVARADMLDYCNAMIKSYRDEYGEGEDDL